MIITVNFEGIWHTKSQHSFKIVRKRDVKKSSRCIRCSNSSGFQGFNPLDFVVIAHKTHPTPYFEPLFLKGRLHLSKERGDIKKREWKKKGGWYTFPHYAHTFPWLDDCLMLMGQLMLHMFLYYPLKIYMKNCQLKLCFYNSTTLDILFVLY